ncbi:MAG: phenylalanine--tRNA ligase subunit beta [Candidatus Eremiobacteraeota bacterium]|nr:phenylalanine--tRNA ligase subunit beta [Candidatus Eremiobacteraeota bacterium]
MRVPISWLREFVALPDDAQAIADRLAMLGFPVAGIERRPLITGVVTGRIATIEKHPNADRLLVARVNVGGDAALTIATAATNVAAGQTIAVATIGARLPQLTIEARTMRGVASQGMMISADELALPAEWFEDGIMQLDDDIAPGQNAVELFGLGTEVLDVEITANRPDAMSVIGLARELAASYAVALRLPPSTNPGDASEPPALEPVVSIESPDCPRFVAQRFDRVCVAPAPAWMRIRLALAGQRPINNLVDVSNYVMLETGQPLHFYDAGKIAVSKLVVRNARDGEKLVTLDGVERTLTPAMLVIADDERVLGLAGLMGGAASEVTRATNAIVLEAATFNGPRVRRMSTAFGLRTEASARHEKSLAPALTDFGAARAAQLLRNLGATAYPPHSFGPATAAETPIVLRVAAVRRLLGIELSADRIASHLRALGCNVSEQNGTLAVTPPPWRRDLIIEADLIEEVARVEGYDRIASVVPSVPAHEISSAAYELESRLAATLAALGYREVITHSLQPGGDSTAIEIRNPLSEERRFLRESLVPGLIDYLGGTGAAQRVFEIGEIFSRDGERLVERSALAFGFASPRGTEPSWHDSAFLRLKGDCEALLREVTGRTALCSPTTRNGFHPGKTAVLSLEGGSVGLLGCVDPRVARARGLNGNAYICLIEVAALPAYRTPHYRPPSRFPSTYRDLALVVDAAVAASQIETAVAETLGTLCTGACVFDEYRGPQVPEGRKSLALRVTLTRHDATITDEEADAAIAAALEAVGARYGATLRA